MKSILLFSIISIVTVLALPQQITFNSALSTSNSLELIKFKTLSKLSIDHINQLNNHINSLPEQRKVEIYEINSNLTTELILTEGEKSLLLFNGINYIDITNQENSLLAPLISSKL